MQRHFPIPLPCGQIPKNFQRVHVSSKPASPNSPVSFTSGGKYSPRSRSPISMNSPSSYSYQYSYNDYEYEYNGYDNYEYDQENYSDNWEDVENYSSKNSPSATTSSTVAVPEKKLPVGIHCKNRITYIQFPNNWGNTEVDVEEVEDQE